MPAKPRRPRKHAQPIEGAPVTLQSTVEATQGEAATTGSDIETVLNAVQMSDEDKRLVRNAQILTRLGSGALYREIAAEFGVSIATVANVANAERGLEQGAIAKLMQAKTLQALEHWETAMESAAKQGKHAAARDWLTHSKALEPVGNEASGGAKVAIVIGMPGSPVGVDSPQVITVQQVSGKD